MPRTRTNTQTEALAETIERTSQGEVKAAQDESESGKKTASKKKAAAKKAASKKEAAAKAKYTRTDALRDALKRGGSRAEVAEAVDSLYVAAGGTSNASGARAMVDIHVPVLKSFGVVKEEDGKLTLNE